MNQKVLIFFLFVGLSQIALAQTITLRACLLQLTTNNHVLSVSGTTNDAGTIRNTYESLPADFTLPCSCEIRIMWNIGLARWEITLDNDGPVGAPDYTNGVLYYNTTPSFPYPPDLLLGTWVDASFCQGIYTLTGDVQRTILPQRITFTGCTSLLSSEYYGLSISGTTNDAGTIRNTYESNPADFAYNCPIGFCEIRIMWNISLARWELAVDNDGPVGAPDYTSAVLYYNTTPSFPFPPDLTLGTWVDAGGFCGGNGTITTLTGDAQNTIVNTGLPIELMSFTAIRKAAINVDLDWATASELNNKGFEVQRMLDSETEFRQVAFAEGAGTSSEGHYYHLLDDNAHSGISYYRLKQVDFDGTFSYSDVRAVEGMAAASDITLMPNPTTNLLSVRFGNINAQTTYIRIFGIDGKLLYQQNFDLTTGQLLSLPITRDFPAGSYFLQAIFDNGDTVTKKFIKLLP